MTGQPGPSRWTTGLTDADFRNAVLAALRLVAILSIFLTALFWWKSGWQGALLVVVGASISAASLWEWLRLMTAVNLSMDGGATPRPMGLILTGFFLRLGLTVVVLYASLKYLERHGFRACGRPRPGRVCADNPIYPAYETLDRLATDFSYLCQLSFSSRDF